MIIQTGKYILRNFTKSDVKDFFNMVNGDEIIEDYVPYAYVHNMQEAFENVKEYTQGDCKNDFYLVIEKKGKMVGAIIAQRTIGKTLDTSIFISKKYRGKGIMTESLEAFVQWLRKNTNYEAIFLVIRNDNSASIRLAQKCGAVLQREIEEDKVYRIIL
ncbi:MAG: GNAT family N-acetyltransferase [Bacilli bacterium]|nr:GNAT family N-acetyltransferase [Bacilli bacterium]